jgi:squalene/oxidosqualene cyclase-like protein
VDSELLEAAVELMLSLQNKDGGWATYELQRGGAWLELLNPSQVFHKIMVDYSWVECTSACIQALILACQRFPGRFNRRIYRAVQRGVRFLKSQQRVDGSWEGAWAICFTYGTWFAVTGLLAAGIERSDPSIQRACDFLVRHQNPKDGGWGEHYSSCLERNYITLPESHVVNTAWALLTLVRGGRKDSQAAKRGASLLIAKQQPNGDWPQQQMIGIFNRSTSINYDNYRRYFPIWALSELSSC